MSRGENSFFPFPCFKRVVGPGRGTRPTRLARCPRRRRISNGLGESPSAVVWIASRTQSQTPIRVRLHLKPRSRRFDYESPRHERDPLVIVILTDPETGVASAETEAAICVQNVDVQCVLQFTLIHAAGCVLHRHTSQVIHRLE